MKLKSLLIKFAPANIAIGLINIYKLLLSPYFGRSCKFYPTCSSYAVEAYGKKGFIKGTVFTIWRLLRCNPYSKGGFDYLK